MRHLPPTFPPIHRATIATALASAFAFPACDKLRVEHPDAGSPAAESAVTAETYERRVPPPTRVAAVADTLHGQVVTDFYRWLEAGDDPEVQAWQVAQNAYARAYLDGIAVREGIRTRLSALLEIGVLTAPIARGDYLFFEKREGTTNQPILYVRHGDEPARALIDPNALSAEGIVALDWFYPSDDGRLVAYGLSESGSEESTLRVIDVATGRALADTIARTRACSLEWLSDASGFYYTRYPAAGTVPADEAMYHRRVYLHRLGTDPAADPLVFGEGRPKEDWPSLDLSPDDRWLTVFVFRGPTDSDAYTLDRRTGKWRTIVEKAGAFHWGMAFRDTLYLMTNRDAPRFRIAAVPLATPAAAWGDVVPEGRSIIQEFAIAGGVLAVHALEDASSRLRVHALTGAEIGAIPLPAIGTVSGLNGQPASPGLHFGYSSFFVPPRAYTWTRANGLALVDSVAADIDVGRFTVEQVRYRSKDGTTVPMFLVHRTDVRPDGSVPTLLYGYGGFSSSETPVFQRNTFLWLEAGGLYAVANLRGGGEYGEEWHRAGMLGNKENTFDDFVAAGEWLVENRWTNSDKLAIMGGSNGGLLTGAAITRRPDLFRAAVISVPLLDMLRYDRFLIGRLWIPEYGDPAIAEHFAWLYRYSPYHRVVPGTRYPAVLLTAAESDGRVDPMHARKFAARLHAATTSDRPILVLVSPKVGHGAGKPRSKVLDELVDQWAFLYDQLDVGR